MIVEERAARIMVGVDWNVGRKRWAFPKTRAVRVLVEPVHVEVEPDSVYARILSFNPPQTMTAAVGFTWIAEAESFGVKRQARLPLATERDRGRKRAAAALETSAMQFHVAVGGIHSAVDDVDYADKRCRSIGDRGGTAHDFDALHVVEI